MTYQALDPDAVHISMSSEESNPALEDDDPDTTPEYPFGTPVYLMQRPEAQQAFARKVWTIFTCQVSLFIAVSALLLLQEDWRHMISSHVWVWWFALGVAFFMLIGLTFKNNDEFQPPIPLVILYTLLDAFVIGGFVGLLRLTFVLDMLIVIAATGFILILYTFQTSWMFYQWKTTMVATVSAVLILAALHPWVFNIFDGIFAGFFGLLLINFFVVDTWYMMMTMFKNEYWAASLHLHLDLLVPVRCVHHMCEVSAAE